MVSPTSLPAPWGESFTPPSMAVPRQAPSVGVLFPPPEFAYRRGRREVQRLCVFAARPSARGVFHRLQAGGNRSLKSSRGRCHGLATVARAKSQQQAGSLSRVAPLFGRSRKKCLTLESEQYQTGYSRVKPKPWPVGEISWDFLPENQAAYPGPRRWRLPHPGPASSCR